MELYYIIAITDHDRGEAMGSLYHAAGLHLILSMPARGTATSEHLAIYGAGRDGKVRYRRRRQRAGGGFAYPFRQAQALYRHSGQRRPC